MWGGKRRHREGEKEEGVHCGPSPASRRAGGPPGAPESHQSHPKPVRHYLLPKAEKQEPVRERMTKKVKVKRNCLALDQLGQHSRCGSAPTKLRMLTLTPGCLHGLQDAHTNPRYSPSTLPPFLVLPSHSLFLAPSLLLWISVALSQPQ